MDFLCYLFNLILQSADSNNYRLEKGAGKGGNCYRGAQNRSRYDMTDPIGPRQKSNYSHD